MDWQNQHVLVTGGGGFIGSHLTEALAALGAKVRAFVHYNAANHWGWLEYFPESAREKIEIFPGDIREFSDVQKAMQNVDVVFHLAALIAIPYSYRSPGAYVQTNVTGTLNILQAALQTGVKKVVHTSTSEVYGTAQYTPIDEKHPLQAQSPYAASKIGADKIAESFYCSYGLPVVTVRPFNTFGPRQSARAVIPSIISQALTRQVVRLGALSPVRDLNFVQDTVRGFILAGECDQAQGKVINLGRGEGITIGELAKTIMRLLNREARMEVDETRLRPEKSEVMKLVCDNYLAADVLGWRPGISLEEGLKRTIAWMSENLNFYKPQIYNL
jgi:dTDP-glucose 4,6-dehydratase